MARSRLRIARSVAREAGVRAGSTYNMSKFVGEEGAARVCGGRILTGGENDVRAGSIGMSVDGAGRVGGVRVGVDADIAEVVAEARLEEGACGGVQRMARRAENVTDDAGNVGWSGGGGSATANGGLRLFLLALFTHFFAGRAGAGCAGVLTHDGAGDVVGFAFFGVVRIAHGELGLEEA